MNYSSDRPIETEKQDLLGRSRFSNQLGKAIYEYNGEDGLVIGLFGKWGTGKTSIINMAVNSIKEFTTNDTDMPIILRFSPWNYSDKDNLILLFFNSLKSKLEKNNKKLKRKVGKALSDYSVALDAFSLVPMIGNWIPLIKSSAQITGKKLMQNLDLDKTKENLEKVLKELNKKIVIIIDDIDRLTNSQIRDIFQLVKQVADFPNIIYVLAMDRDVVTRALTEVHNIDGNEYIEKIIQIPFELPELRKSKLNKIFLDKVSNVVNNISGKVTLDQWYWSNVFHNCIEPYIHTLRDVNRVINTFQFRYGMVYEETSFEDMVGLVTLEVLEPKLYKWICHNKKIVCNGIFSREKNKEENRKFYKNEFESLGIDSESAIRCISTMFPAFADNVNDSILNYNDRLEIRGNMRVADVGRFEVYFMFDLDDIEVSRTKINLCLYELDQETLKSVIEEINTKGSIIYFLDEIQALLDTIPYNRLKLIASVLLEMQGKLQGEKPSFISPVPAYDVNEKIVIELLKKMKTKDEVYSVLNSTVCIADMDELSVLGRLINSIELAYGRLAGDSEKKEMQIISVDQLLDLEKKYVNRIYNVVDSKTIFDIETFSRVHYLWKCFDPEGLTKYLKELFTNNEMNKLKFLCATAICWRGFEEKKWNFSQKSYEEYFTKEEVYNLIQNLSASDLNQFNETQLIKLAAFVLNYHDSEMDDVSEKDAEKLVKQWRKEKV
ncbi:KAP family P-loop NTPase fold protein [Lactobacillus intestinalis]|uniref:KAP family P-loop NTPase fold protein n=2 Tax=Bacillota TaxID=1239 RepID=UPI0025A1A8C9|nr:P-loop NTPase fold protein [Lactobacillus intestinalis]